jgi:carboxymethylenebutenolidase
VWGYCTGATLAMLAASLDRKLGAAVLFFPSQPTFEALTAKRPSHAMDLVWSINCPVMLICGDQDAILPPPLLTEIGRRFDQWNIPHQILVYPGAGHAFSAEAPHMYNARAAAASWTAATDFVARALASSDGQPS